MAHTLSNRINSLPVSQTLAMAAKARELKAAGKDIISLSLGEPDFNTPEFIKDAAVEAINQDYNSYLLLERIDPNSLLIRVKPTGNDLNKYEQDLVSSIEDEFVHNLSQQIYVSVEMWNVTRTTKNTTIQIIRQTAMNEKIESADKLREAVLNHFMGEITPSQKALAYLKKEIHQLF